MICRPFVRRQGPALAISLALGGLVPAHGQFATYDSHNRPAPHEFDWQDRYDTVDIYGDTLCEVSGGFLGSFTLHEASRGLVTQGWFQSIVTRDQSSLLIVEASASYVTAREASVLDFFGTAGIPIPVVQAGEAAVLRLRGGLFGQVHTAPVGGRIELRGNLRADEVAASEAGIVVMSGGVADSLSSAMTGVTILDGGAVSKSMTASNTSTLVLAGGIPPQENLRLFDRARVLVFHGGAVVSGTQVTEKVRRLRLADLNEPGFSEHFAGLRTFLTLDGFGQSVVFSASNRLGEAWTGSIDLIRVDNDLWFEWLPDAQAALLAFRVPDTQVAQAEISADLTEWQPLGEAAVGDFKVHTRTLRLGTTAEHYFRLRTWLKP